MRAHAVLTCGVPVADDPNVRISVKEICLRSQSLYTPSIDSFDSVWFFYVNDPPKSFRLEGFSPNSTLMEYYRAYVLGSKFTSKNNGSGVIYFKFKNIAQVVSTQSGSLIGVTPEGVEFSVFGLRIVDEI